MTKAAEQKLLDNAWTQGIMCLIFAGLTYGFASLAIDSGNLAEYALTILFLVWTIKCGLRVIRGR